MVACGALLFATGRAMISGDSSYALVASGGIGYSMYAAPIIPPRDLQSSVHRGGFSGSIRIMWHPDHLLRVGVESGWTRFFSYSIKGSSEGNLALSAVPLLLVFSMPVGSRFNLFAGAGGYFVYSNLNFETAVRVTEFSQGWMLAASYDFPLSPTLGIAGEFKWYNASQFEDGSLMLQAHLVWRILEW